MNLEVFLSESELLALFLARTLLRTIFSSLGASMRRWILPSEPPEYMTPYVITDVDEFAGFDSEF